MRFSDLRMDATPQEIQYSQYCRRADGARARVMFLPENEFLETGKSGWGTQHCFKFPGKWSSGQWSHQYGLDPLTIQCIIADWTEDPCQAREHPGPPLEVPK